jgi:hypothetical protein
LSLIRRNTPTEAPPGVARRQNPARHEQAKSRDTPIAAPRTPPDPSRSRTGERPTATGRPPSTLRCTPVKLTSGSSPPHPLADVLVLAEASESYPDDMAAIYGPISSRPPTPPMASHLT